MAKAQGSSGLLPISSTMMRPMLTLVVMPQMGESIAEGTIVRWIKQVGDRVDRDEPLFEISTDKVDAEIPSPAAGVLTAIMVREGETVAVDSVVGSIGEPGEMPTSEEAGSATESPLPVTPPSAPGPNGRSGLAPTVDERRRSKSSPLVRRMAREHDVDISQIVGSGVGGRVTKTDVFGYIGERTRRAEQSEQRAESQPPPIAEGTRPAAKTPAAHTRGHVDVRPLSVMRRRIAEHMLLSRRTSAHVHTVFHVNFSTVERIRRQKKADYERLGVKLTYMSFIAKAVIDAIRTHPIINASIDGDNVVYKKDVNLGIAVALDSGLIVPVVKNADERNILGLTRALEDIVTRARSKQLKPEDVQGGTFTITNPGQAGAQFGMPIINQPQAAILGVGTIERRPVVVDDAIAIRTMAYMTLGFDHRLVDGAVADAFMADVKHQIEHFDPNQV